MLIRLWCCDLSVFTAASCRIRCTCKARGTRQFFPMQIFLITFIGETVKMNGSIGSLWLNVKKIVDLLNFLWVNWTCLMVHSEKLDEIGLIPFFWPSLIIQDVWQSTSLFYKVLFQGESIICSFYFVLQAVTAIFSLCSLYDSKLCLPSTRDHPATTKPSSPTPG